MRKDDEKKLKQNKIVTICLAIIIASINLSISAPNGVGSEAYSISYENINIKNMAAATISEKSGKAQNNIIEEISGINTKKRNSSQTVTAVKLTNIKEEKKEPEEIKPTWRLPVEQGRVTQNPSYGHVAMDITSPRGSNETIYPIANGVVTSIYADSAGGLTVTVRHLVNNQYYTSKYVHFKSFAPGLYVGQEVTTDTPLGQMGTTGISTGIHLHISVIDCNLYDPNDVNCSTTGKFYNYLRLRYNQGFKGLRMLIDVPYTWNSR